MQLFFFWWTSTKWKGMCHSRTQSDVERFTEVVVCTKEGAEVERGRKRDFLTIVYCEREAMQIRCVFIIVTLFKYSNNSHYVLRQAERQMVHQNARKYWFVYIKAFTLRVLSKKSNPTVFISYEYLKKKASILLNAKNSSKGTWFRKSTWRLGFECGPPLYEYR